MINPNNPVHLNRLQLSIEQSRRVLDPWRAYRRRFIEEFVGSRYSDNGTTHKKLVNLMNQTAEAYIFSLVAARPRVLISTHYRDLQFFGQKFQIHLNNLLEELKIETVLREVVLDAFFSMGIVKVYMGATGEEVPVPGVALEEDGYHGNPDNPLPESIHVDPGKPFIERISLDDWFHDTNATRWDKIKYCGDFYRLSFDKLKDPIFDQEAVKKLSPTRKYDQYNDDDTSERAEDITRNEQTEWDEVVDMIDLMDIWLPYEKKVVILPKQRSSETKPLAVIDWDGPENGPYRVLGFQEVPDNLMPSSPAQNIADLEGLVNNLLRKLERQAKRQKTLAAAAPSDREDAERAKQADDGEIVFFNNPETLKEFSLGGINQSNNAFAIQAFQLYNKAAGNPEAMLGLGPQSGTASQDQLIHDSLSQKQAKMAERVVNFTADIAKDLGWLMWIDAYKSKPGMFEIPDAGVTMQADWTPEEREGDYLQYNFSIDPYSMQYQSPSQRAGKLTGLLSQIYLPSLQYIMQQGGQIDWQELNEILAELHDLPRLKNIIKFDKPPMNPRPDQRDEMSMSGGPKSNAPRETIRHNVSTGGTQQSKDNLMMQSLLAGGENGGGGAPINQDQMGQMGY